VGCKKKKLGILGVASGIFGKLESLKPIEGLINIGCL
jgi:hypothetical protein